MLLYRIEDGATPTSFFIFSAIWETRSLPSSETCEPGCESSSSPLDTAAAVAVCCDLETRAGAIVVINYLTWIALYLMWTESLQSARVLIPRTLRTFGI